jgi:7,8-didemethyl-8-hydroxy-5-deazariboflavin synthase CofH subunit
MVTMTNDVDLTSLEVLLRKTLPSTARALSKAMEGKDLDIDEISGLFETNGIDMQLLLLAADELRKQQVGDTVTYIVNRNINFTNVCVKQCGFCAFSRDFRNEQGYYLPLHEVIRRTKEAVELGATEICVQAGLAPNMDGNYYIELTRAIKAEFPDLHIHGFSPEEVLYGSNRSRRTIREYLMLLKEANIGSLPGTSAEILVQSVRDRIAQGRISAEKWEEVIRTAHDVGIRTTSTIMYGHIETYAERAMHLDRLRSIQKDTGGFTEFVPLSFVHTEAPMWHKKSVPGLRSGPSGTDVLKMHAISRVVLGHHIPNLQASWVKEGPRFTQLLLQAGVNDLGGTLINESISTSAGAAYGQFIRPAAVREMIRDSGRIPAERTTLYQIIRKFDRPENDFEGPLDRLTDEEAAHRFGSYKELINKEEFRYIESDLVQNRRKVL